MFLFLCVIFPCYIIVGLYHCMYVCYMFIKDKLINQPIIADASLYKNISMLFLFPVKDGSTGVNATFNASCYG